MKLDAKIVKELFCDDYDDSIYEVIEEGDWTQDHKYQWRTLIFKFEGLLYSISTNRSGSPFTDWYYEWEDTKEFEAYRVEPITKTITVYKVVNE